MSDKDIELEIQEKGKTAPRVTPEHIDGIIASEHYFTLRKVTRSQLPTTSATTYTL